MVQPAPIKNDYPGIHQQVIADVILEKDNDSLKSRYAQANYGLYRRFASASTEPQSPLSHAIYPMLLVLAEMLCEENGLQLEAELENRLQKGIATYGVALQPHNGRDALMDCLEEVLDAVVYSKQDIKEN